MMKTMLDSHLSFYGAIGSILLDHYWHHYWINTSYWCFTIALHGITKVATHIIRVY